MDFEQKYQKDPGMNRVKGREKEQRSGTLADEGISGGRAAGFPQTVSCSCTNIATIVPECHQKDKIKISSVCLHYQDLNASFNANKII